MALLVEYANILLPLAGGIGIFLLGMKFLSEGLQTIAGNRLKTLIGMATNNRLLGVGMGALVTGIIQSSSITTVLVISFVDAGLMTLAQAVGVIMGANVGTTITAWILTIKIDQYGIPLAGIAAIVYVFSKKETVKYVALGLLGLGCVFMGLLFMKEAVTPIATNDEFKAMFAIFHATDYFNILKCAALGCLLTIVVQSSSVTIGITMVLAASGLINFQTAAALGLGGNVGTTITAFLASLGTNNNARRAACFHALFNFTGAIYVTALFAPFIDLVEWILSTFFSLQNLNDPKQITFGIAAVHSVFNVLNTLVFLLPCRAIAHGLESKFATNLFTKLKLLRKETAQAPEVEALLEMMTQIHQRDASYVRFIEIESRIKKVLTFTGEQLKAGINNLNSCIENSEKKSLEVKQIFEMENNCDKIKDKFMTVLTSLVGREETSTFANQQKIFAYERIFDSLESTSDYMAQVAKLRLRLLDNKTDLLDYQKRDLLKLNSQISEAMDYMFPALENVLHRDNFKTVEEHEKRFAEIKDFIRSMRTSFWNVSTGNVTDPIVDDAYSNMLSSYRKIRDHLRNSGNAIFGIDRD